MAELSDYDFVGPVIIFSGPSVSLKRFLDMCLFLQELFDRRASAKLSDQVKQLKMQIWSSVVTIVLMEGTNLSPMDDNGLSDPYCRFTLGEIRQSCPGVFEDLLA